MCLHRVDPSGAVHQVVRERDSLPTTVGAAGQVLRVSSGVRGKKFDEIRRRMFAASFGERDLKQPHTPLRCSASMESLSGHSASRAQVTVSSSWAQSVSCLCCSSTPGNSRI
jgi:hypothetical protein